MIWKMRDELGVMFVRAQDIPDAVRKFTLFRERQAGDYYTGPQPEEWVEAEDGPWPMPLAEQEYEGPEICSIEAFEGDENFVW